LLWLALALSIGCGDKQDGGGETLDADGDGFNDEDDCAPEDPAVNPDAVEACDGADNDCDASTDEGVGEVWYADGDEDGYGDPANSTEACELPEGYTNNSEDCNDADAETRPGAEESCDNLDNDCDDRADEGLEDSLQIWFRDADEDGYGDAEDFLTGCVAPDGYVADDTDCDDSDAAINPGATDEPDDEIDQDCSGEDAIADGDGDGYLPLEAGGDDCDDGDPEIHPDAEEVCDGVDNNCDGEVDDPWLSLDFDEELDPKVMTLNGDALQVWDGKDGYLELTSATAGLVGSAFLNLQHPGDRWVARFTVEIGGGGGADGMTFAFLYEDDPTLLSDNGGALGVAGFDGYAVEWDSYYNGDRGDPISGAHVALVEAADLNPLWYTRGSFRNAGPIEVVFSFEEGDWSLSLRGKEVGSGTIDGYAPGELMFGFTAATGAVTDRHTVDDFTIECLAETGS
jgi:hypothetical protein